MTPPPPRIPPARSRGRVSQGVGPPSPGPGVGSARRLDPLLGMSGPAECAGLFPLSPALFPLVLAFLVAIACWFHCFPGFLLGYCFSCSGVFFCFVCFFKSFFSFFKKQGLQELACIADNIMLVMIPGMTVTAQRLNGLEDLKSMVSCWEIRFLNGAPTGKILYK